MLDYSDSALQGRRIKTQSLPPPPITAASHAPRVYESTKLITEQGTAQHS